VVRGQYRDLHGVATTHVRAEAAVLVTGESVEPPGPASVFTMIWRAGAGGGKAKSGLGAERLISVCEAARDGNAHYFPLVQESRGAVCVYLVSSQNRPDRVAEAFPRQ